MVVWIVLLVVSTGGASDTLTSTETSPPPGFTPISSWVFLPIATVTFSYRAAPKPLVAVVTTSYVPGGTCSTRQKPSPSVVIVLLNPEPTPVVVVPVNVSLA